MILYKYFPCNEFTYRSLVAKGLWAHTYDNMNDPFECLNSIEREFENNELDKFRKILFDSKIDKWEKISLFGNQKITEMINLLRKKSIEKYAFCSLTEDPNNILMWSHYANSHKGIVIGFEFPELKKNHTLQKVNYSNKLNKLDLEEYARYLIGENDIYLNEILKDFSIKSEVWKYEKEWRIWINAPYYYYFKPENIKEVHFGIKSQKETKLIIMELMNYLPQDFQFNIKKLKINPLELI